MSPRGGREDVEKVINIANRRKRFAIADNAKGGGTKRMKPLRTEEKVNALNGRQPPTSENGAKVIWKVRARGGRSKSSVGEK